MNLYEWAQRWNVSGDAIAELRLQVFRQAENAAVAGKDTSNRTGENTAQRDIRIEAADKGMRLWRNNVGVLKNEYRTPVRYGLANDSKAVNTKIKSGDLIGIRPILITDMWIGHTIGQFVSREVKAPGWLWSSTESEVAQQAWAALVISLGGDACFATGPGTL